MELKQCVTCGASSFTNGKCDYCGNQYEVNEDKICYGNSTEDDSSLDEDIIFQETPAGKLILKIMIYTLVSIVWFAVTVFIPPLFIITIILLVVYVSFRLTIKKKQIIIAYMSKGETQMDIVNKTVEKLQEELESCIQTLIEASAAANITQDIVVGNIVDRKLADLAKTNKLAVDYIEKVTGKDIDVVMAENVALEAIEVE